jgi:putative tryptophan/tyrosine transport system substrate-binding protein
MCDIRGYQSKWAQSGFQPLSKYSIKPIRCRLLSLGEHMRRREFITLVGSAATWPLVARAQQSAKMKRIAMVSPSTKVADMSIGGDLMYGGLLSELKLLGYAEGDNLIVERYSGGGRSEGYSDLAREVVGTNPDLIFAQGTPLTLRFKNQTTTIPIVALTGDPIRFGIVSSLAHPGGNVTGVSVDAGIEIWAKRLALLAEAVPRLTNVILISTQGGWNGPGGRATQEAAQKLGISLVSAPLPSPFNEAECRRICSSMQRDQIGGVAMSDEGETYSNRLVILELVDQMRVPAVYPYRDMTEAGGLMSYSWDIKSVARNHAMLIAKILRGTKPSDLPYIQEVRFELVINLKTAKTLGLEIPAGLAALADAMIE